MNVAFICFLHAENFNGNLGRIKCKSHKKPVEGNIMLF